MTNPSQEVDNLSKYYTQKKQRIDLFLDMNSQKVVGQTKLTFVVKNEIKEETDETKSAEMFKKFKECINTIDIKSDNIGSRRKQK